jgi:hypothetical protein
MIQARVVEEYALELERAKQPGYVSRYDDAYEGHEPPPSQARTGEGKPGVAHERETSVPPPHIGMKPTIQPDAGQPDASQRSEGEN